MTAIHFTAPLN